MAEQLPSKSVTLDTLNFDNRTVRSLPIDPEEKNFPRRVSGSCFSWVKPTPCLNPKTVSYSSAMRLLDLDKKECERPDFAEYFSGNKLLPGCQPAAHCYCGHQFGSFAGQLGDGATMYLGEILNSRNERWEIQFKGAGLTPYSRTADGRKVLRSSIREYLCSEAMHHLGIPTTRAGCCVVSDSEVARDIFYNGNPIREKCTIILRIAETFLRIGSFEICKPYDNMTGRAGPSIGQTDLLRQLLDYTISSFYSEIAEKYSDDPSNKYKEFFKELMERTTRLVAQWQCIGFCHGVLNTDNTSITGLTIDYGPFGFMDQYNPDYICNASDDDGRYSYVNQPKMLKWNLLKLVEALKDIIPESELMPILNMYDSVELLDKFLDTMHETHADFTNCFRSLSSISFTKETDFETEIVKLVEVLMSHSCTVEELKEINKPDSNLEDIFGSSSSFHLQAFQMFGPLGALVMNSMKKEQSYNAVLASTKTLYLASRNPKLLENQLFLKNS
ncbi:Selenoprotein O [Nymphon striatum]|nr:Selenoprotein O [Nymphon striatum]